MMMMWGPFLRLSLPRIGVQQGQLVNALDDTPVVSRDFPKISKFQVYGSKFQLSNSKSPNLINITEICQNNTKVVIESVNGSIRVVFALETEIRFLLSF